MNKKFREQASQLRSLRSNPQLFAKKQEINNHHRSHSFIEPEFESQNTPQVPDQDENEMQAELFEDYPNPLSNYKKNALLYRKISNNVRSKFGSFMDNACRFYNEPTT